MSIIKTVKNLVQSLAFPKPTFPEQLIVLRKEVEQYLADAHGELQ